MWEQIGFKHQIPSQTTVLAMRWSKLGSGEDAVPPISKGGRLKSWHSFRPAKKGSNAISRGRKEQSSFDLGGTASSPLPI